MKGYRRQRCLGPPLRLDDPVYTKRTSSMQVDGTSRRTQNSGCMIQVGGAVGIYPEKGGSS